MAIPVTKEEYRPAISELVDAAITDPRFVGYLQSLIETLLGGTPTERHGALITFGTLAKKRAENLERDLLEQAFDQVDY